MSEGWEHVLSLCWGLRFVQGEGSLCGTSEAKRWSPRCGLMESWGKVLEAPRGPITSEPLIWCWTLWWLPRAPRPRLPPPPPQTPGLSCPQLLQKLISDVCALALRILFRQKGNIWTHTQRHFQRTESQSLEQRILGTWRQKKWFSTSFLFQHLQFTTV